MTPLRLDYQRSMQPFPWAGAVLLALALSVLTLAYVRYMDLTREAASLEEQAGYAMVRHKQPPTAGVATNKRGTENMDLEIRHANEVLQQISLPWGRLFQAIESSSGKQVALLSMEPDAEKYVVKLSGEAKNITAVLNYVKRLSAQEVFSSVYLQSHQIQQQDQDKPVRFALLATWKVSQ
jgi:hypothetical protein